VGKTTHLTVQRSEYIPADIILANVKEHLDELPTPPDYITLSGSGEPTLHSGIAAIITEIKRITSIPVAVLTNSSLLYQDEVAEALSKADVVLPSLDAASDGVFQRICRPHPSVALDEIIRALKRFRRDFGGQVWLEVLLCRDINDSPEEIDRLQGIVAEIDPHKVQLNTVDRPPPEGFVLPLHSEELLRVKNSFGEKAEIVASSVDDAVDSLLGDERMRIVELLGRRPGTLEDISKALRMRKNEVVTILDSLKKEGRVHDRIFDNRLYYHVR